MFGNLRCIGRSICAAVAVSLLALAPRAAAAEHGAPAAGGDDPAAAWRAYIARRAVPLPDPDDVSSLLPVLASRDLVLLGETTHGTHEYYAWRSRISKMLIARAGFRFIAVEGDWSAISRLDRYVRHLCAETPSARSALRTFDRWAEARANPLLLEPLGHRAIGVVHAPGTPASRNYVPSVVPLRYDGILFIRDTRALDRLEAE